MKNIFKFLSILSAVIIAIGYNNNYLLLANAKSNADKQYISISELPKAIEEDNISQYGHVNRILEEEDEYSIVFSNQDGSNTKYLFSYPVKYTDEDNKLKDITLDIVYDKSKGSYITKNNDIKTTFGKELTDGINLQYNNICIDLIPIIETYSKAQLNNNQNKVSYKIDDITDYEYGLTYSGFKEDIVVKEYTGQTEYKFHLYTNGLKLKNINGQLYLVNEKDAICANIGDVIVFTSDEKNNTFGDITFETIVESNDYILTINIDSNYLNDPKTLYPIRIDPTIEINRNNGANAIQDVTINSLTGSDGLSGSLYIGKRTTYGISRVLMKFPGLNISNLSGAEITSAYVEIRDLMCENESMTVNCYRFTGNEWNETTANWSNVNPNNYTYLLSSNQISNTNGNNQDTLHRYRFNILDAARMWADDTSIQSKGIIFKADDSVENGTSLIHKTFSSYNRNVYQPSLVLTYSSRNTSSWGTISARGSTITGTNRHITFVPETTGTYKLMTAPYPNSPTRDTKIYVFDSSNSLIASNDDYNPNINRYSFISCNLTAGSSYRLFVTEYPQKITNMDCYLMIYKDNSLYSYNSQYYNLMKDFNKIGDSTGVYNCLSYAIGITSDWTWPWGVNTPTKSQVTEFMNSIGYTEVASYTSNCVVAYGISPTEISHFSLVTNGFTQAKCGSLELMKHTSYNAYFPSSTYGVPQAFYVRSSKSLPVNEPNTYISDLNNFIALDSETQNTVYEIINNLEISPTFNSNFPKIESNYNAYRILSDLGNDSIPYILQYIEESKENGYTEAFLVSVINEMLGKPLDSINLFETGLKSDEDYVFTPKWYAKQLWNICLK